MSKSLLSQELIDVLCLQLVHEKFNSTAYMYIAGWLRNKGLNNIAEKFMGQWKEEIEHSKQIFDFLTDMNCPVSMDSVDSVDFEITTMSSISSFYLDREILTTTSLEEIKKMCIEENNGVAEEFLRQMINQQRAELEEASTFYDEMQLIGDAWALIKLYDLGIGE